MTRPDKTSSNAKQGFYHHPARILGEGPASVIESAVAGGYAIDLGTEWSGTPKLSFHSELRNLTLRPSVGVVGKGVRLVGARGALVEGNTIEGFTEGLRIDGHDAGGDRDGSSGRIAGNRILVPGDSTSVALMIKATTSGTVAASYLDIVGNTLQGGGWNLLMANAIALRIEGNTLIDVAVANIDIVRNGLANRLLRFIANQIGNNVRTAPVAMIRVADLVNSSFEKTQFIRNPGELAPAGYVFIDVAGGSLVNIDMVGDDWTIGPDAAFFHYQATAGAPTRNVVYRDPYFREPVGGRAATNISQPAKFGRQPLALSRSADSTAGAFAFDPAGRETVRITADQGGGVSYNAIGFPQTGQRFRLELLNTTAAATSMGPAANKFKVPFYNGTDYTVGPGERVVVLFEWDGILSRWIAGGVTVTDV